MDATTDRDLPGRSPRYEQVISALLEASHRAHPEAVAGYVARSMADLGMRAAAIYLIDVEQRLLVPLASPGLPQRQALGIDSTLAGRAFRTEQLLEGTADDDPSRGGPAGIGRRLWMPLIDGSERLGILAVTVDRATEETTSRLRDVAAIAAAMVVSYAAYGDEILCTRRLKVTDLAAELRWEILPPLTYVNDLVAISAILEPAYEIAGDAFDYAMNGDIAHLAVIDAMGHGLEASQIATLAVAAYRNRRRAGADLVEMFRAMDEVVSVQFGPEKFVTGQLGALNTTTGHLRWINAGHPHPLLLRGGRLIDVEVETCLPFGMGDVPSAAADLVLEPGDAVLFFTDGVTEARSPDGELFGPDRLGDLLVRVAAAGEPVAETVRKLCHAVLSHQSGRLQDDATMLLVSWRGRGPVGA